VNVRNTKVLKFEREIKMERKDDLSNRIVRDAWLKEHGGTAVKEENVWYWISPEPAPKKVNKKVANKRFF
jgi:hypothetical protein